MFRMSKQADYGIVLLSHFVLEGEGADLSARDLAEETGLPAPTVAKVLKQLTRGGILASKRGADGGYHLLRSAREVSVADVLRAMHEPVGVVDCTPGVHRECSLEKTCPVKSPLMRLNDVVMRVLSGLTLRELVASA